MHHPLEIVDLRVLLYQDHSQDPTAQENSPYNCKMVRLLGRSRQLDLQDLRLGLFLVTGPQYLLELRQARRVGPRDRTLLLVLKGMLTVRLQYRALLLFMAADLLFMAADLLFMAADLLFMAADLH